MREKESSPVLQESSEQVSGRTSFQEDARLSLIVLGLDVLDSDAVGLVVAEVLAAMDFEGLAILQLDCLLIAGIDGDDKDLLGIDSHGSVQPHVHPSLRE